MNKWRRPKIRISRPKTIAAMIAIAILGIAVSTTAFLRSSGHELPSAELASNKPRLPDRQGRVLPIQNLRFTLYQEGIFPRRARAHKGQVAISVEDLVGTGSTLVVERRMGSARVDVGRVRRLEKRLRGRSIIDLLPGTYRLSIAERPNAEAELVVEP